MPAVGRPNAKSRGQTGRWAAVRADSPARVPVGAFVDLTGRRVIVHSLSKVELNGRCGWTVSFDQTSGRYRVELDDAGGADALAVNLKPENIRPEDRCVDWAIGVAVFVADQGDSWWMPLVLLGVVAINSLTGGMFIWCSGVLQSVLFSVVVLSNKKYGIFVGPFIMTLGSSIAAVTYIQLMQTSGADALLASTGAKDSKWLEQTMSMASSYGWIGMLGLQIAPIPIPTAVSVVAGMMAKMNPYTIFSVLMISKYVQLTLGAVGMKYVVVSATRFTCTRYTCIGCILCIGCIGYTILQAMEHDTQQITEKNLDGVVGKFRDFSASALRFFKDFDIGPGHRYQADR